MCFFCGFDKSFTNQVNPQKESIGFVQSAAVFENYHYLYLLAYRVSNVFPKTLVAANHKLTEEFSLLFCNASAYKSTNRNITHRHNSGLKSNKLMVLLYC